MTTSHQRWVAAALAALLMLLGFTRALAQEIDLSGQIRPRFEGRDFVDVDGDGDEFVSMRTRLGVAATISPAVRAFAQIQDVRFWGGESGTTDGSADMLDLHQAWAEVGRVDATTLRVGRQEVRYGAERLVGALDWVQQGRAFDGVRVSLPLRGARIDGFWFRHADETAGVHPDDAALAGVYATAPFGTHAADAFAFWNTDAGTSQGTVGGRLLGRAGIASARLEGAAQFGTRADLDVAAHLLSGGVDVDVVDGVTLSAMYDWLSGDDDAADAETRVFDTLFATNHRFYGFADVFLNIPAHTGGRGLEDVAVKAAWRPADAVSVTLDLHRFRAAAGDGLTDDRFGDEADFVVAWRQSPNVGISGGVFWFDPAAGMAAIGRGFDELLASYIALDVTF